MCDVVVIGAGIVGHYIGVCGVVGIVAVPMALLCGTVLRIWMTVLWL